ncbi:Dihydroflavonol-4-reductase [Trichoplax sp. H2]|nr:Dihydroflavonol-4-reductase [Trichoplax sp. H2]|eukprot:RDD37144.1 Dihydroflavonol-4-reductase [Trichoplax sp. H2]
MAEGGDATVVLVTGASGFVAAHVCYQLLQKGYKVRGTVRDPSNEKKCKPLRELCPDAKYPIELVRGELTEKECWIEAVKGCHFVVHIASPLPAALPKDEDEIIKPAVNGTLNVLEACVQSGTVKRVVLTSSVAAVSNGFMWETGRLYSEKDWTDPSQAAPYEKSKTLAEKAAWDFIEKLPSEQKFELAVINPVLVLGPVMQGSNCTSMEIPMRLLMRQMPAVPKLNFPIIDVRDLAAGHVAALTSDKAAGNRHIMVSENMWFAEIAKVYTEEFKSQGYRVPTLVSPNWVIRLMAFTDPTLKALTKSLSRVGAYDTTQAKEHLDMKIRPARETVIDMAYSLIERGFVPKTAKYTGPKKA